MTLGFEPDRINLDGLEKLLKALKTSSKPVARVGILGSKDTRSSGASNATIGAVHEYGSFSRGIPQRSFLRVPISAGLQAKLQSSGMMTEEATKEVLKLGSVIPWLKKAAVAAEGTVLDAFDSEGPGWAPWKDPNYTNNANMILNDTGQLRDSITSDVKEK